MHSSRLWALVSASIITLASLLLQPAVAVAETGLECGCIQCMTEMQALAPDPLNYVSPSRNFRTLHTALDLDINLEGQGISGSVTHTLECLRTDTTELLLNCVRLDIAKVEIDAVAAQWQYPVLGRMETSWLEYQGAGENANLLRIIPAQSLQRGQQIKVQIWYSGKPQQGLYFQQPEAGSTTARYEVWSQGQGENNRFWFPCFDYPNDKATYEGRFRVAKPFSVLSNGALVDTTDLGDRREFHWWIQQPQVSYLTMVAVGEYEIYTDDWRGKPVNYWVAPGTGEATARRTFHQTVEMLDFFSKVTGTDYPYDKYAQVVVQNFIYGGMENTTATVLVESVLLSEDAALTRDGQGLIAHELAHMWWGDMLTCREWSHMWLNEGFATYFQKLYRQHADGDDWFIYEMDEAHREVLGADSRDPRPIVVDFFNRRDSQNNANIYVKGASVLDMLREHVGDEVFFDAIGRYGREHQWQTVETSDLSRAFTAASGENLDWFFEQWVYLSGHPDLRVTKQWDEGRKLLTLTVEQTQKVTDQVPLFRLPLEVEFTCSTTGQREGSTDVALPYEILVDKARQDFYFSLPSEPLMVLFDKGGHTLKTLDFKRSLAELHFQLSRGDTWGRIEAARALGDLGANEDAAKSLAAVLADESLFWGLRKECALALAKNNSGLAQQTLTDAITLADARSRLAVVETLSGLKLTPQLSAKLSTVFRTDASDHIRSQALRQLIRLNLDKGELAKLCLEAIARDSHRNEIRNAGIDGLKSVGDVRHLPKLQALAAPGNSRSYRHNAIDASVALAKADKAPERSKTTAQWLTGMLSDWNTGTRGSIISSLVTLGEKGAVEDLRRVAAGDPVERIRKQANQAALDLAAQQSPQPNWDEMNSKLKALQDELDRVKGQLGELEKRVPQK